MKNAMMTVEEASQRISAGATLMIAGDGALLAQLPKGNWIGGTSVYFVTDEGGCKCTDRVFVSEFEHSKGNRLRFLPTEQLSDLASQQHQDGLTLILIPAMCDAHQRFALDGAGYPDIFSQPVMGWISGIALEDIGKVDPLVFDGSTGEAHKDGAVVMHLDLGVGRCADIDIINLFEQDPESPTFLFKDDGFGAKSAVIDGEDVPLSKWIAENNIDVKRPLVANYAGAMINVSFQSTDTEEVTFYGPVIAGVEYKLAKDPGDYATVFSEQASSARGGQETLSCNCVLNYVYGELEGKTTGSFTGPATFGEIAYVLLNQTLVRVNNVAMEQSNVA